MNQDAVKELLISLKNPDLDFSVIFSGKQSTRVNGLYKPENREIIIHNRNFDNDNMLVYTAIHEYAHHLQACAGGGKISGRAHTVEFWSILHSLLKDAEGKGLYKDLFAGSPELEELTTKIREKCLYDNGQLVKELGKLLLEAKELCDKLGGRFEDYVDRVLRLPRVAARTAMRIHQSNLNPALGADNMKIVAGIRNGEERAAAEKALLSGDKSPDQVRMDFRRKPQEEDSKDRLVKEKQRLERTIEHLQKKLEEVEQQLEDV